MKHISGLIARVSHDLDLWNLLINYYIGRHYLPKIGIYLFDWIHPLVRRSFSLHC